MTGQAPFDYESVNTEPMIQVEAAMPPREVSQGEAGAKQNSRSVASVLLKAVLVTGVLSGAYFAATKLKISNGDRVVLNNAFVNYVGTVPGIPIAQHSTAHSAQIRFPVCAPEIVAITCEVLNNETQEYWNDALDARMDVVHIDEITESLMVHKSWVEKLFQQLENDPKVRLPMIRNIAGGEQAVACMDLCHALVASYPPLEVSTHSDVGCYLNPRDTTRIDCDINLSPRNVGSVEMNLTRHNQRDAYGEDNTLQPFEKPDAAELGEIDAIESRLMSPVNANSDVEMDLEMIKMRLRELKMMLLNRFRVWPVVSTLVQRSDEVLPANRPTQDTTKAARPHKWHSMAPMTPALQGTNAAPRLLQVPATADWRKETLRIALEAKAKIVLTLVAMNSRKIGNVVTHWFGNNDENTTRKEIKRVMAGVHSLLDNVDFRYPGSQCQARTYAYVFPGRPWNKDPRTGKYIFHLCDTYMKAPDGEKIETLIHEGSHHNAMLADDEKWSERTMYGRAFCESVATECMKPNQVACMKALRNADTYCYFVNDAANAATGKVNAWDYAAAAVGVEGGEGSSIR